MFPPTPPITALSALPITASALGSLPLFITPEFKLPPLWAYPAAIILLILVGVTSLGLAKLYVKVKVMLGFD